MSLKTIRLELGRTTEFPQGSSEHGYQFIAPLTREGFLDVDAWKDAKARCTVTRFWAGKQEHGRLRHTGSGWRFDYVEGDLDDEPFFKLEKHKLAPGSYLTIREHDGIERPFKVVDVAPAPTPH